MIRPMMMAAKKPVISTGVVLERGCRRPLIAPGNEPRNILWVSHLDRNLRDLALLRLSPAFTPFVVTDSARSRKEGTVRPRAAVGLQVRLSGVRMTAVQFGVLGPLAVTTDAGEPVVVPGTKVRVLLADLLANRNQVVSADRLIDDLWGDDAPANPAGALQVRVSQLRKALNDAEPGARDLIESRPPGYLLRADAVDADRFAELVPLRRRRPADRGPRAVARRGVRRRGRRRVRPGRGDPPRRAAPRRAGAAGAGPAGPRRA